MTTLAEDLHQLDNALHESPPPRGWFLPLEDITRIDEAIEEASRRLVQQPAQLARLLPSLRRLHRHRRDCVRSLVDALAALPGPQLAERLTAVAHARGTAQNDSSPAGEPLDDASSGAHVDETSEAHADKALTTPETVLTEESTQADAECLAETVAAVPLPESSGERVTTEALSATETTRPVEPLSSHVESPVTIETSEPPAPLASAPVDLAGIADFSRLFRARQLPRPALSMALPKVYTQAPVGIVRDALGSLGSVPRTLTAQEAPTRRDRLVSMTLDLSSWQHLAAAQQADLLTLLGALARDLQERHGLEMGPVFTRLTVFSEREQPGFVHGLARKHTPRHGHWLEDARRAERSLRRWLGDDVSDRHDDTQEATSEREPASDSHESAGPDASWPWWGCTRGRRAVLVGGSPRDSYQRRLHQVFGFASLDWVDGEVRRIKSLGRSIEHGGVDLVLVVRQFIAHRTANKVLEACKQHGVPFATIDHGHGVSGVQRAVERFLTAPVGTRVHAAG